MWIIGDSHVKRTTDLVRRTMGYNLGLQNCIIWWNGSGGAKFQDVEDLIHDLRRNHNAPHVILVHLGTNDLSDGHHLHIYAQVGAALGKIKALLPFTSVILSEILDRPFFHGSDNQRLCRYQLRESNRALRRQAVREGARVIRHPDILGRDHNLFSWDCVHLSNVGYTCLATTFARAIEFFRQNQRVFFY